MRSERRDEQGRENDAEHLPMGETPVPRKKSICIIKIAWKRDNRCKAV
jgi:hypothetical protein